MMQTKALIIGFSTFVCHGIILLCKDESERHQLRESFNTVRPCDVVFALWNGPANISLSNEWSEQKVPGTEVAGLYSNYQKYINTRGG